MLSSLLGDPAAVRGDHGPDSLDSGFLDDLPEYQAGLQTSVANIKPALARIGITMPDNEIGNLINPSLAMSLANTLLTSITQLLSNAALIGMFVILMLLEASELSTKIDVIRDDEGQVPRQYRPLH